MMKMNWGNWIFVSFVLFAGFIATLVTVCVREDISLVSKDYYQKELVYQDQIGRIENASLLAVKPSIKVIGEHALQISFDQFHRIEKGELQLFRPSDAAMDKNFHIEASNTQKQFFSTETMQKGMYRARMVWTMGEKEFYIEEVIFI
jgi:hypothetical protein